MQKILSWLFLWLLILFGTVSAVHAAKSHSKIPAISFSELVAAAQNKNILIRNFSAFDQQEVHFHLHEKTRKSHTLLLAYIRHQFANTALIEQHNITHLFLLPAGVNGKHVVKIVRATAPALPDAAQLLQGAGKIKHKLLRRQLEIKRLAALAARERDQHLHYERFVNPANLASAYSFDLRYQSSAGRMVPYLRNGKPVKGKMEGYASFSTVLEYIDAKEKNIVAYRAPRGLLLQEKGDPRSFVWLKSDGKHGLMVVTKVAPQDGPKVDYRVRGDGKGFRVTTHFGTVSGTVTLADIVTVQ